MTAEPLRRELAHGPERTVSWIWFADDGTFCAEFYDHSDEAERWFGNDVAYDLTITPGNVPKLAHALRVTEGEIADAVCAQFGNYFALKKWLQANNVVFEETFDSWA